VSGPGCPRGLTCEGSRRSVRFSDEPNRGIVDDSPLSDNSYESRAASGRREAAGRNTLEGHGYAATPLGGVGQGANPGRRSYPQEKIPGEARPGSRSKHFKIRPSINQTRQKGGPVCGQA
jgi:hypothetical protein